MKFVCSTFNVEDDFWKKKNQKNSDYITFLLSGGNKWMETFIDKLTIVQRQTDGLSLIWNKEVLGTWQFYMKPWKLKKHKFFYVGFSESVFYIHE
jgi:hypothetical protein